MTEMIWFFPALVCLCLSWTFSISFQWLGFLCSLWWLLRVCFLKNKRIKRNKIMCPRREYTGDGAGEFYIRDL